MRYQPVFPEAVAAHPGLGDWQPVQGRLLGCFRAPTFATAAEFVAAVGRLADRVDHHPDVDLRFPGVVRVAVTTHAIGGLSDADVSFALAVGELAGAAGLTSVPGG